MPKSAGQFVPMETLPLDQRLAIDKEWQKHWYQHLAKLLNGTSFSVLDVGSGTGYGLLYLRQAVRGEVKGIDVVHITDAVEVIRIEDVLDESWDVVAAIDVIEHVEEDKAFLADLLRVAKSLVFISTPNWNVSRCVNAHHVREYTPVELRELIAEFGFISPLDTYEEHSDHSIYVSNHERVITTRESFDPNETWHNQAVLLKKAPFLCRG